MARDPARDVVRGLTSLEMTFVNYSRLPWTGHSGFIGQVTYADTVFPCFAFLSGMSRVPARRNIGLIGLGLGLNTISAVVGAKSTVRIPGVLQRMGVASLVANEPRLAFLREYHGAPLVALWYAITLLGASSVNAQNPLAHPDYPASDATGTAQTRIDKLCFGHALYRPTFDPEGLLGSLTTAVSMILGCSFLDSTLSRSQKALTATAMVSVGELAHHVLPKYAALSKSLWTPSFVLVTSGYSILKYLALEAVVPYLPTSLRTVLEAVGKRPLEAYIISSLLQMALTYGGPGSISARAIQAMSQYFGPALADLVISTGLTASVAALCELLVSRNLRLRW